MDSPDPRANDALQTAGQARERAYAPYSRFRMGAAVVTDAEVIVPGALVENVSLGLAMCAERTAFYAAVAYGHGRPRLLALVSPETDGGLTWPCGACLQVAMELGGPDLLVLVSNTRGKVAQARLHELAARLPFKRSRPPV